jgi:GrpB-like predicted nucleotidyltransferase (UPF0157 family)
VELELLIREGLGLDYDRLWLSRTTEGRVAAGAALGRQVADLLDGEVEAVEQIGSSSVVGLLAKPIVDLAVGLLEQRDIGVVRARLEAAGWIYRGDAGGDGGQVFVLEARPWHRVAHLHVVEHGGPQWVDYLRLRDLLRRSPPARRRYEAVKVQLVDELRDDRRAYTEAKTAVVRSLLDEDDLG